MNWLEPWILIRLLASAVATATFAYAAIVGARVLRHAHVEAATEGRLLLERHFELAATLLRVGAIMQIASTLVSIVAADRLSSVLRGAMCGYGVVSQNPWGPWSIGFGLLASLGAGAVLQLLSLDRTVRGLDLMRAVSIACLILAPAVAIDWGLSYAWLSRLDLSVVSSCCSTSLDGARREGVAFWQGPRVLATWGAGLAIPAAAGMALIARRRPGRVWVGLAGLATLVALPLAVGAVILEVAPYVYDVPEHLCPFCLFKSDAYFIGYPLLGPIFLATVWGLGATVAAAVSTGAHAREAFPSFARVLMARQAVAWTVALVVGALPVVLHTLASPGALLFR